jgi:predicted type IV restriction endonuclease
VPPATRAGDSGQAIEAARRDYRNAARKRPAQRTLPDAWTKLIESEDELLIELLSDKVEDLCGVKPDPEAVAAFLRMQPPSTNEVISAPLPKRRRRSAQPGPTTDVPKSIGYELYGQRRQARNARDVLI